MSTDKELFLHHAQKLTHIFKTAKAHQEDMIL